MNDNALKAFGIVAVVAVIGMFFFWYMSPYQQCVRTLTAEGNKRPAVSCLIVMNKR